MPITHTVRLLAPYRSCRPFFHPPRVQAPSLRFLPPRRSRSPLLFAAGVLSHTRPIDLLGAKLEYRAEGLARASAPDYLGAV